MSDTTGGSFKHWKDGLPNVHINVVANDGGSFKHWLNGKPMVQVFPTSGSQTLTPDPLIFSYSFSDVSILKTLGLTPNPLTFNYDFPNVNISKTLELALEPVISNLNFPNLLVSKILNVVVNPVSVDTNILNNIVSHLLSLTPGSIAIQFEIPNSIFVGVNQIISIVPVSIIFAFPDLLESSILACLSIGDQNIVLLVLSDSAAIGLNLNDQLYSVVVVDDEQCSG